MPQLIHIWASAQSSTNAAGWATPRVFEDVVTAPAQPVAGLLGCREHRLPDVLSQKRLQNVRAIVCRGAEGGLALVEPAAYPRSLFADTSQHKGHRPLDRRLWTSPNATTRSFVESFDQLVACRSHHDSPPFQGGRPRGKRVAHIGDLAVLEPGQVIAETPGGTLHPATAPGGHEHQVEWPRLAALGRRHRVVRVSPADRCREHCVHRSRDESAASKPR